MKLSNYLKKNGTRLLYKGMELRWDPAGKGMWKVFKGDEQIFQGELLCDALAVLDGEYEDKQSRARRWELE